MIVLFSFQRATVGHRLEAAEGKWLRSRHAASTTYCLLVDELASQLGIGYGISNQTTAGNSTPRAGASSRAQTRSAVL